MNIRTAQTMLVRDRLDSPQPWLFWLPRQYYRAFNFKRMRKRNS